MPWRVEKRKTNSQEIAEVGADLVLGLVFADAAPDGAWEGRWWSFYKYGAPPELEGQVLV